MKSNDRAPIRIGKIFKQELEKLQARLFLSRGVKYSLSELSDLISKTDSFKHIESELESVQNAVLRFDGRRRK